MIREAPRSMLVMGGLLVGHGVTQGVQVEGLLQEVLKREAERRAERAEISHVSSRP